MTFTEWYKVNYNDVWHEDYALLYGFAIDIANGYEEWCKENNQTQIWNG